MILADTSAWVEFDRATGSPVDLRLTDLIGTTDDVAVTEPVVMEVLAGAKDDARKQDLRRLLHRFALLRFDAAIDIEGAARIYRTCRRAGVTPNGMVDCMVAAAPPGTVRPCSRPTPTWRAWLRCWASRWTAGEQIAVTFTSARVPRRPMKPGRVVTGSRSRVGGRSDVPALPDRAAMTRIGAEHPRRS